MGQNSSKGEKNTVAEYKPTFEVIRVIDDPNYGRVKLIRETKTHQQMILKEFIFDTKQAFEEELKFFKERAAFDHPHIVQVIGYNATQNQNLCSSLFKVSVFIEIISKELYTVLRERKRAKAAFSEADLLIIAENVIQALYHLQTKNMAHGDIRPLNIFVTGQSYKVTDPKLEIDKNANALVKAIISNSETLLSPQLVAKIPTKKFEITEDKYKADVFSLGATLLNVATLKNSEELYDYQAGKIKEDLLRERLEEVKHQYSPFTYQLISDMLKINEQERPDFVDLRDRLLPHHEAINTKQDLPFITHHQETFGNVPAAVQKQGGERAKKAAVLIPDEDREERLPSFASETHHTAGFGQPQRTEPVFHHHEDHYVPAAVTHHHEQHYVEPPQYKSNLDTDDLEAKIRAALQRSQNTYKQVQESEAHYGTHQHQPQVVSDFHSQRPLVSFGPSSDFVQTQQQQNVPHTTFFEHTHSFLPEHRVNAPRQPGYEEYMRESQGQEHRVMAPRQPGWEVEVSREVAGGEHRVMAPRQPGYEVEVSREITGGERRVMAPRQPGIEVEINRDVGGERKVNAPRQPGIEETVKRSALPQNDDVHVHAAQHHVEVPATRTSGFIHTEVPATRTSGFIQTSEPHVAPQKVEEYHHYVPSTTPATYEFSYTGNTYTPNTGYATQNLGLLESLKKTSEAALAHQQELQRQSETQNFGHAHAQPASYHQHESVHTYQPASYTTTSYDIGAPISYGTTAVRTGDEHVVRSTPVATDDVRKVGEVGGNSAYNANTFTYTPGGYGFNLPKAAADDVFAFTPQTYTVEHTAAPQTTTTYNYTTGTVGQGYGHHEPASYTTTDYHFTTAAPGGYTAYGAGNDTKANGETEKVLKSYHVEETPQIQSREVSYSPTLPSVTPKHHVTNIQTTEFGKGDTVTYGTHTPTNAYPGADRPGGILGEVSSAVSKYTFTTVEEGGQNQLGDSPARFI